MLTYIAERGVAYVFHGGQEKRECRNLYIADVYHDELANLQLTPGFVYMMKNYRKSLSPWSQLGLFLLMLGGSVLVAGELSLLILTSKGIDTSHGDLDLSDPKVTASLLKLLQALSTVVIFALPAILYARLTFREQTFHSLGFRRVRTSLWFLLAVAALLFSFPMEGWLGQVNRGFHLPPRLIKMEESADKQLNLFLRVDSPLTVYVNLLVMALLPAICEEMCFRGALQRILINLTRSPWGGIVLTGLIFSAIHMQFLGFLPRAFLGMILGAIYWYSGSLWVSILAHFFYNGIQVIAVSFYPKMIPENSSVPLYLALISLVIVVGLLSVMRRMSGTTYERVYE